MYDYSYWQQTGAYVQQHKEVLWNVAKELREQGKAIIEREWGIEIYSPVR